MVCPGRTSPGTLPFMVVAPTATMVSRTAAALRKSYVASPSPQVTFVLQLLSRALRAPVSCPLLVRRHEKLADIYAHVRKVKAGAGQMTQLAGIWEETAGGIMVALCIACAQKSVIRMAEGRWRGQRPRLIAQQTICKLVLTLT